jgi:REP element-mobilizing transposase RayT
VTSRGNRHDDIYLDDTDRAGFLDILGDVCHRFQWTTHAYCLMTNHYHLVLETAGSNLSRGMRHLNGVYTQRFNRRHGRVGHVFQGRYKAILVQKEAYLLALSRYVVLNPVRAQMVVDPADWIWSNYRAVIGHAEAPSWLDTHWVLSQFGHERAQAIQAYTHFVHQGVGKPSLWEDIRQQVFLGDEAFVARLPAFKRSEGLREVPRPQRQQVGKPLVQYQQEYPQRDEAMARAYHSGMYTMREIGDFFGVHYMTVSRAVRKFETQQRNS